ncbi:hypothetical protein B0H11DRAFT_1957992 [Mycena galericulata]|nr:hypothetical protein B0H11DRAFT_1957992 [Mycena galericulata]
MPRQRVTIRKNANVETANESPKKRAKARAHRTRRFPGRGKLRMLPEMPLDILFEIFGQLDPPDVLRLSRTTKALRNSAFMNDPDLPGLPAGLTEPQYANLAFSPHCHFCFTSGEHNILWAFHVRVCHQCLVGRFDECYKIIKKLPRGSMTQNTHLLRRATVGGRIVYSYDEAAEIINSLSELKKGNTSKLEEYINERRKTSRRNSSSETLHHASKAEMSGPLRMARKQRMLQEARDRRKEAICRRLGDLGYGEEETLSEHVLIKSHNALTDRMWDNMKPELVDLMRSSLLKKRQGLVISILKDFIRERPIDEVFPRAVDICVLPHVKAMIEDHSPDAYSTEDGFQDLAADLPRLVQDWREAKTQDLLALLPGPKRNCAFLLRATTFFSCNECSEPLGYPRDDIALLCQNLDSEPWNSGASRVVRACGLDVEMTLAQDMDDVGAWFECVFRWRKAILHDMYHAASGEAGMWKLLGDADADAAEALQEKELRELLWFSFPMLRGHLRASHGIDAPEVEEDYVLHVDASMDQPPFPILLPPRTSPEGYRSPRRRGGLLHCYRRLVAR